MPFWKDLVYATRRLLSKPGFLVIALLTLALGVGFNAAIFTFVNAFLIKPLPIADPSRVMTLNFGRNQSGPAASYPDYRDIRDRNQVFTSVAAMRTAPMALSQTGKSLRIWGFLVSGNYFETLGIAPSIGRFLTTEDDGSSPSPVAVLGYGLWQRQFAGDPAIVGKSVKINGEKFTIVGVAPQGFIGTERFFGAEIWVPFSVIRIIEARDWRTFRNTRNAWLIGRLKAGLSQKQAEASLAVLAAALERENPNVNEGFTIRLSPPGLGGNLLRRPVLGMGAALLAVALLTLLVACSNLSGLVLAHAADRRKEMAIRLAIGAGRGVIVRLMLAESLVLGVAGGLLGLLTAVWLSDAIQAWIPSAEIPLAKFSPDWRVLLFGIAAAMTAAMLSGLIPSMRAAAVDVAPALKNEAASGLARGLHLRDVYVGIQVTVCMILLAGSVMMVQTLKQTLAMSFGFDPNHTVVLHMDMALQGYSEAKGRKFQRELIQKIREIPGAQAATLSNSIPLSIDQSTSGVTVEGKPVPKPSELISAILYQSGSGYFRAMGTRLLAGRDFEERDGEKAPKVVIVNQAFVQKMLPGEDAVGKRMRFGTGGDFWQIVGVAETGKYQSINEDAQPVVWQPDEQRYNTTTTVILRSRLSDEEALADVRKVIAGLDPEIAVYDAQPLGASLDFPLMPLRLSTGALTAMGGLAALLCALGLYGLLAYSAVQRTREIGIRMALGAKPGNVLGLLLKRTVLLVGASGAVGIFVSFYATRVLAQFLFAKTDASIYGLVVVLLAVIALIASLFPALRVLRIHPLTALRHE
jgi:predicted permease